MKNLKNFTEKLNLNKSKVARLSQSEQIKGGIVPETSACVFENGSAANTFTLICPKKDTIDTQ